MEKGFKSLEVWRLSKQLAVDTYALTSSDTLKRDFGLVDQMRRAAVSVASNIAEGDERDTNKESVRFFYIAKGSAAELYTQLEIAETIYGLDAAMTSDLKASCDQIARMLRGLIKARSPKL
ncbi:MAG: four helix bundle protein [Opitutales bacterium]|nr:four helix bundle protein [Opitutales bacterium]